MLGRQCTQVRNGVILAGALLLGCTKKDAVVLPGFPSPVTAQQGSDFGKQLAGPGQLAPLSQAPELEGLDMDGAPLKLTDQRGNVVVLVCYAHF